MFQLQGNDVNSYSGSGTTWYDVALKSVSGYTSVNYNGSLSSSSNGYDSLTGTFDFTGQYITIPDAIGLRATTTNYRSFVVWAYITTEQDGKGIFSKMYGGTNDYDGFALSFLANRNLRLNLNGSSIDNRFDSTTNNVYDLNTWTMFSGVICFGGNTSHPSKVYVNGSGIPVITANSQESYISYPTAPIIVPSGIQTGYTISSCKIGAVYYYDSELSDSDIVDIYDSTKANYEL